MATHAPNYSNRYKVRYTANGKDHVMTFRYGLTPAAPPTDLVTAVSNFIAALSPKLTSTWAILSAGYIQAGDTAEFPTTLPTGAGAGTAGTQGDVPRYWSFTGRGVDATPVAIYVYGATLDPADGTPSAQDYRILSSEDTDVASAIAELQGAAQITSITGLPVTFNPYANVAYSGYWQKKLRKG